MNRVYTLVFYCALAFFIECSANYVPVAMWTNIRNDICVPEVPTYPGQSILKLMESEYFRCLEKWHPKQIKLFLTEELDVTDFTLHTDDGNTPAFHHFQNILASSSSVLLPAVLPTDLVSYINGIAKQSFPDSEISFKELPTIARDSQQETVRSILKIDQIIREENENLEKSGEYIAFFIAESSPQNERSLNVESASMGRQLLAVENGGINQTEFIYTECIYITYTNITFFHEKRAVNLTSPTVNSSSCGVSNTTNSVTIDFVADGGKEKTVTLKLIFENKLFTVSKRNWWLINSANITHSINSTEQTYSLTRTEEFTAPLGWSWVCKSPPEMVWRNTKKQITQRLAFANLQIQPFEIKNASFSRATDCSGLLSGPIWTGTVVSILLAVIFAFGLAMMSAVSTMDRFDDPRGKPLMVHTHDSGN